ncbi:MAG: hypothetical protein CME61_09575 [Halobacteriovoraceae bacterium]|nr:hypothetical protein [Halobacteriovoraceae bacterium]
MYTISEKSTILEALKFIEINGVKTVIVISENNKVIGVISQGDVLRSLINGVNVKGKIINITNTSFKFLNQDFSKSEVIDYFKKGIDLLPILNPNGTLKETLKVKDYILRKIIESEI